MLKNYFKIALKVLLRRKFFTFISLFGISVTLVVLMVASALLDHVFGPQAPDIHADRTLSVYMVRMRHHQGWTNSGPPSYTLLDRHVRTLPAIQEVTIHSYPASVVSYWQGRKITSSMKRTDGAFWRVMRFEFLEGGPFTDSDEKSARPVAVITESARSRFFGNRKAEGRWIEVDGQRFRVVGVVKNVSVLRMAIYADLWVPISTAKTDSYRKDEVMGSFMATILARSKADFPQIKTEFQARLRQVQLPREFVRLETAAETPMEWLSRAFMNQDGDGNSMVVVITLMILALLFMLLPAVNLININVSRMLERASEIGVRRAYGASRKTLIGQFLVENVILCLVGGLVGLVLSLGVLQLISFSGVIPYAQFHMNLRIFGYGMTMALVFAVLSGVYPAWRMARLHPVDALKQSPL